MSQNYDTDDDDDVEYPHPWSWWLPFMETSSDDETQLKKTFWSRWRLGEGRYVADELLLVATPGEWALGLSYDSMQTSGGFGSRPAGTYRAVTLSIGPLHLILQREVGP